MGYAKGKQLKNPGCIRKSADKFQGEKQPSSDPNFKEFVSMAYGYRAMFVLLNTYYYKYNLKNVQGIINRWAPSNENPTSNYINYVANYAGLQPNQVFDFNNRDTIEMIVSAMAAFEMGEAVDRSEVLEGYELFKNSGTTPTPQTNTQTASIGFIGLALLALIALGGQNGKS